MLHFLLLLCYCIVFVAKAYLLLGPMHTIIALLIIFVGFALFYNYIKRLIIYEMSPIMIKNLVLLLYILLASCIYFVAKAYVFGRMYTDEIALTLILFVMIVVQFAIYGKKYYNDIVKLNEEKSYEENIIVKRKLYKKTMTGEEFNSLGLNITGLLLCTVVKYKNKKDFRLQVKPFLMGFGGMVPLHSLFLVLPKQTIRLPQNLAYNDVIEVVFYAINEQKIIKSYFKLTHKDYILLKKHFEEVV